VSRSGQISVNPGLTTTKAGQVEVAETNPSDDVVIGPVTASCAANGIYKVPAGRALIITGVTFFNFEKNIGTPAEQDLTFGPAADPCSDLAAAGLDSDQELSLNQSFQPGVPVPAGDAVGLVGSNSAGSTEFYGYLVPSAAVPASADHRPAGIHGTSPTVRTR
jgi:hypothetical protein